jgi:cardiolipin synthase
MRTAVVRGVKVDLIVSKPVDQWLVHAAQASYYAELMAAGIGIHAHRPEFVHAKAVSIDGRVAVVGSSNVDMRSFELNEEASLLIYDAETVAAVELVQRRFMARAETLDRETWRARPLYRKVAENVARMVGSLL